MDSISRRTAIRLLAGVAAALLASSAPSLATEKAPLAMKGYDPVGYFTEKRAIIGDPQHEYEWDGAVYRFASAQHLDLFKRDPDRYLPQYNNLCAASVAKGIKVEGNPEYWHVANGRLYLFGGPGGPDAMKGDPAAMTRKADENYPKIVQSLVPAGR